MGDTPMSGPTSWAVGEIFTRDGIKYRVGACTDTFAIATRVGAERDRHYEVKNSADIIKIERI